MQKMPSMSHGRSRAAAAKLRKSDAAAGAGTLTLVLVVISLIVFTVSARDTGDGFFGHVRGAVQTITSPIRTIGSAITSPFSGFGNIMRNLTADEQTLTELREENEHLVARNVELEEAQLTAQRLQALLDVRDSYQLTSIAARVISGSMDSWTATVIIDKGSAAGVSVGMPVANEYGAVGQVISCAATTATVRLLEDEGSSVSAMLQTSRAQGMLRGSVDGTLHLTLIRTDQTVDVGSVVVTSGLGGVFPKGLPMGKVSSVKSDPGATYYDITVEPFTRVGNLEEVLVITSLTEGQQASADDIASADAADLEAASGRSAGDSNYTTESIYDANETSEGDVEGDAPDEGVNTATMGGVNETTQPGGGIIANDATTDEVG